MNSDEANRRIPVIFSLQPSRLDPPSNMVLVVPTPDSWNDFGHHTQVTMRIRIDDREVDTSAFIGFVGSEGASYGRERIQEILTKAAAERVAATTEHEFFTMLPDLAAYRLLVRSLGAESATAVLRSANDLVALGEFEPKSEILDRAAKTQIFALSFVRSSEAYFAYKNAGSILRGLDQEELGALSPTLSIRFQLPGRANEHHLSFHFDHQATLPKRIAVVIGKNGVGKSQTLGRIARAALDGAGDLTDGTDVGRPVISRLLAFAPTNEAESVFPTDRRRRPRIWYQRYSMNRSRRSRRNDYVADLIVQVARSSQQIASMSRWEIFLEAIRAISESDQLHLQTSHDASFVKIDTLPHTSEQRSLERFSTIETSKEPVRLVGGEAFPLSSGEISFLKFAAQASLHIENGSLLLLDEPETHLHPNFISRFVSLLDRLLEATGSSAIIATHSAYFVREVFREQVTVLSVDSERIVRAQRPSLRTFGADVGAISYFVFGEDEPSRLVAEVEKKLVDSSGTWDQIYKQYGDELSLELLNSLRSSLEGEARP